ncbi:MAG TPA: FeoA family protein [Bacteroidales bacterium]|nr:FeoA family protein [Bacteroidales bacterium]
MKLSSMDDNNSNLVLTGMKDGQAGIIVSVTGGHNATKRLADLGLSPGTRIRLMRKALFSGPVQVDVNGSRLVLGWGLASKIIVRPE